jgi:hypothetical protein
MSSRTAGVADLTPEVRFLIVTEGSSDAKILAHALKLLRPEIEDFFRFVDMEEGYPFTGTGNLHKFCQGLVSIGVLNRVLIVYDNDAEGTARYEATRRLTLPPNMHVMKLPDLSEFERCPTVGPNGEGCENVNGRAAAIECYLDLTWRAQATPCIRWTSYNREVSAYQGELMNKDIYKRRFLELRFKETGYDFSKLDALLDAVVAECVSIANEITPPRHRGT